MYIYAIYFIFNNISAVNSNDDNRLTMLLFLLKTNLIKNKNITIKVNLLYFPKGKKY